jgi:hypothetical protein
MVCFILRKVEKFIYPQFSEMEKQYEGFSFVVYFDYFIKVLPNFLSYLNPIQMKFLLIAKFPHEPFNSYVKNGTAGAKIQEVMEAIKPEAAYFSEIDGLRAGVYVVNIDDYSELPSKSEPLFLTFGALVQFHICMSPEDLSKSELDKMAG